AARACQTSLDAELKAFRNRQAELLGELARTKGDLADRDAELAAVRQREERLDGELQALRARQAEVSAELEHSRQREAECQAELQAAKARQDRLAADLAEAQRRYQEMADQSAAPPDAAELAELRSQRDALADRLDEAERRVADLGRQLAAAEEEMQRLRQSPAEGVEDDYRRRYEMAVEDVRNLKAKVEDLEAQLRESRAHPGTSAGGLDWEAEKRRILAALESDGGEPTPEDQARRVEIEEVIRRTEAALSVKDRELAELRQLLEDQSKSLGSVAVGAAALGEMLDNDAIVREERENLRKLQEEWREKLRQAEVEISVERAKIARERAQLEERLRALPENAEKPPAPDKPEKPARGRWLSRLGLKDPAEE
ncbi:MAG: hypothetical protein NUV77_24160, partial [Thermoguttaceae bacterium]|nr:hypothetical protein [Thermoguttaceae bacterium]